MCELDKAQDIDQEITKCLTPPTLRITSHPLIIILCNRLLICFQCGNLIAILLSKIFINLLKSTKLVFIICVLMVHTLRKDLPIGFNIIVRLQSTLYILNYAYKGIAIIITYV